MSSPWLGAERWVSLRQSLSGMSAYPTERTGDNTHLSACLYWPLITLLGGRRIIECRELTAPGKRLSAL